MAAELQWVGRRRRGSAVVLAHSVADTLELPPAA
jgi:hypothetical protein